MAAPALVLFDVVETLVSLDPLRDALPDVGLAPEEVELVFSRLLRDAFALAASGTPKPFPQVATSALQVLAPDAEPGAVKQVVQAIGQAPAQLDARPAIERLVDAGVRVAALSNGTLDTTTSVLERTGLAEHLEAVLSVDDLGTWKPAAQAYRGAVERLGVEPSDAALVAVHAWDVHGARHAGLRTGWCRRLEGVWASAYDRADVEGDDLFEVAGLLLRS